MIGAKIAHYEITEQLGEGGMGVVYKARDTHLDRFVAIKVLPPEKVANPDRKRRFVQEAKAASALNHPNIITIHDIVEEDGTDFMVMEYVAGKTLDELIPRKGMRLNDVLKHSVQIADALAAAHEAGIVHRDMKPSNVMVNEKGQVKVLDFGLAKLTELVSPGEEGPTQTINAASSGPHTEEGTILGTVSYMSPEQAEGRKVDARSDIFAFGSLLYEMVTGQQAFRGDSKMSTLAAILNKEQEPLPVDVPHDLNKIVSRCLRKDLNRRFQHMDDVKIALEELKEESDSGKLVASPTIESGSTRRHRLALAAAVLVGGVAVTLWLSRDQETTSAPGSDYELTRLTSDSGLTFQPAVSNDGKLVAYASDRSGEGTLDIWVLQVAGGQPARLTRHPADDYEPAFSPDGSRVAFRSDRDGGGIYVVSTLGGDVRLIAGDGRRPRFSPDGQWLVYWVGSPGSATLQKVYVVSSAGGSPKQIQPDFVNAAYPIWLPDSERLLFAGRQAGSSWNWWVAPVDGGTAVETGAIEIFGRHGIAMAVRPIQLHPGHWLSTGNEVLFSARAADSTNLWKIPISLSTGKATGPPIRVTAGTALERQPTVAASGRLVFSSMTENSDLWSFPVDAESGVVQGEIQRLTNDASSALSPSVSSDGRRLVFESNRSGNLDVWTKDLESGKEVALTVTDGYHIGPVISLDGSHVAYRMFTPEGPRSAIYVSYRREAVAEKLCEECGGPTDWSADGTAVLIWRPGEENTVSLINVESREVIVLLQHPEFRLWGSRFSPDDRWIAFHCRTSPVTQAVFVAPVRPGKPPVESEWIAITDGTQWDRQPGWSPGGNLLYFTSERDGFRCIWAQRLDPATKRPQGAPFAVHHVHNARHSLFNVETVGELGLSVATDKIVYATTEITGNIWMMEPK